MDASEFRDDVEDATQTELDRIGSSKRLVAVTGADLETDTVLRAAAESEAAAAEVFDEWAGDSDGDANDLFVAVAEREREHRDRLAGELGGGVDPEPGAVHDYLRDLDGAVERAGGLVGRGLVAERTLTQFVSYFVNDADERRADLVRELRAETDADTNAAAELLADVCEGDDWERAGDAAVGAVETAYEEYVDALDEMGVDAKSVC